mmetsp:Transcript_16440/g.39043  ORF Transcript_16440/g.39043 Transcript_16440/m.39043 type:complete len:205 (+) Transcript_16440:319-933(+)
MHDPRGMKRSLHLHSLANLILPLWPHVLDAIIHAQAEDFVPFRENAENFRHLALVLSLHHLHNVTWHDMHLVAHWLVGCRVYPDCKLPALEDRPLPSRSNTSLVSRAAGRVGWCSIPGVHCNARRICLAGRMPPPRHQQGERRKGAGGQGGHCGSRGRGSLHDGHVAGRLEGRGACSAGHLDAGQHKIRRPVWSQGPAKGNGCH